MGQALAVLPRMQEQLEDLHGVNCDMQVGDYLIAPDIWQEIPGAKPGLPEQLFVLQHPANPEDIEVALYIAPEVISALEEDNPHDFLHHGNLENYCIALEGVSHFVMVAERARWQRPVRALELEIQAEVDKFVLGLHQLLAQGAEEVPTVKVLLKQLFESYHVRDELASEEAERYVVASRVAQKFCAELVAGGHVPELDVMRQAVRRFIRQDLGDKLRP